MVDFQVEARGLVKSYGTRQVVTGIDFQVRRGSCFGFLGPNGAGKTTTLRMLTGTTPADSGQLRLLGLTMPQQGRAIRARIGIVPQLDNLDPDFTVAENLRVYGGYFGLRGALLKERIEALLAFVELSDRAAAPIESLSGGMRRRLTIARALINDPELIILDEPTTGLDPQVRHMIWGRLRALIRQGKTLILTTHYMEEAERLCDQILVLDQGRVLDQGTPRQMIERHVEPEVIEIQGQQALLDGIHLDGLGVRQEQVADALYCYTQDAQRVVAQLADQGELTYLHRPATLEDVFLRLTGRDLRD